MSLAIKIVRKAVLLLIGFAGVDDLVVVVCVFGVGAEGVPAVAPLTVLKLLVALIEAVHNILSLIALSKVASALVTYYGVELNLNSVFDIKLYEKSGVPKRISLGKLGIYEVEVTLAVYDVTALILLVAAYAVAMLGEDDVCAVVNHSAAKVAESGGGVLAVLLTTVIKDDEVIALLASLSDIYHSVEGVEGVCTYPVGESVGVLVLANVDNANLLALKLEEIGLSGVLVVLTDTGVRQSRLIKSLHGVTQTLNTKVKYVVIAESYVGYAEFLNTVYCGRSRLKVGTELFDCAIVIGESTLKVNNNSVHILCKSVNLAKELLGISLNEKLLGNLGRNYVCAYK